MAKKKSTKKQRSSKYDEKLSIDGTVDDVFKIALKPKKKKDSK